MRTFNQKIGSAVLSPSKRDLMIKWFSDLHGPERVEAAEAFSVDKILHLTFAFCFQTPRHAIVNARGCARGRRLSNDENATGGPHLT